MYYKPHGLFPGGADLFWVAALRMLVFETVPKQTAKLLTKNSSTISLHDF